MLRDFPQGCPNPSRGMKKTSDRRVGGVLLSFFVCCLLPIFKELEVFLFAVAVFSLTAEFFLLSCDSIPPEEKARRRAKNEMKNLAVQSTGA
jgi:hypothetical protein